MSELPAEIAITFEEPGWKGCGLAFKERPAPEGLMMVGSWDVRNVYRDPCHWRSGLYRPPVGPSVDDLIEALAGQKLTEAGPPQDVSIDGYRGRYLRLEVRPDLDTSRCDEVKVAEFRFLNGPGDAVWWLDAKDAPGLIGEVWVLDVAGSRAVLQAASYMDAPDSARDEIHRIVESIDFLP